MWEVECEALPGLEGMLEGELARTPGAGRGLRFEFDGPLSRLLELRIAQSVYLVIRVAAARPTALLGEQHLRRLEQAVATVRPLHPPSDINSFRLGAAGHGSTTFRRLAGELATRTGLSYDQENGDLLLRVRRAPGGWEALVRISPRPLSARPWRVINLPGALNATIAAAMIELTRPDASDRFANLACGSATLLIERLLRGPAAEAIGYDLDHHALRAGAANLAAAGLDGRARLLRADVGLLPRATSSLDVLVADLPYGDLVGSHAGNVSLYPALLREAARVAAPDARFAVVTHDIRLFERCLSGVPEWRPELRLRVFQGGHRPQVSLLRRRPPASGQE
jgi:tRNA (guanine6-N2)-methyltransferase